MASMGTYGENPTITNQFLLFLSLVRVAFNSERGVRNVCAYFTGIARKYLDPDHAPPR